jgi:apolipoprotein D and lipocalin family protein
MRKFSPLSLGLFLIVLSACSSDADKGSSMTSVDQFEVQRYLGKWHQIAAVPAWFQRDCVASVTAEYAAMENGHIEVVNSCDEIDGSRKIANGQARFQGIDTVGKLDVTFASLLGAWLWPIGGNYWIIGLDDNYQWSIVGEPTREYGWILSRSDTMTLETLSHITTILRREKYDPCNFVLSTPDLQGRLCDLAQL